MKAFLIYLAGFATPFVILLAIILEHLFREWKRGRRYQRAWDKFTAEWNAMTFGAQSDFIANEAVYDGRYATPMDAWFAYRWKHGHTTEV